MKKLVLIILLLLTTSCAHYGSRYQPYVNHDAQPIWVVNYSWHSGIILKKDTIPETLIPEKEDFPEAEFLEIGWGNKAFYQEPKFKLSLAMKALLLPGPSTMAIHGFSGSPNYEYWGNKVIYIQLSPQDYVNLIKKIDESFDRKGQYRAEATLRDVEGRDFYDAHGRYGVLNTCNHWTARVLRSGGLPISTSIYAARATHVIAQVERYNVTVNKEE